MVDNDRILERLLFEWENFHCINHPKQDQSLQTKPNHQLKQQWSMVMIRDSVPHSDLSVFPPVNHENLHHQIQPQKQNPPTKSAVSLCSDACDLIPSSSGGYGIGEWLGIGLAILRAKIVGLASYFGYKNRTTVGRAFRRVIDMAAMVLLWWLCKRLLRRSSRKEGVEQLRMVMKQKDERIAGLLNQIAEMNQLLVERHKYLASKMTH